MVLKFLLMLVACVAYVSADGHDSDWSCADDVRNCQWQYQGSMDDYEMIQRYYNCVNYVDCGDDYETDQAVKQATLRTLEEIMKNWHDHEMHNSATVSTLSLVTFVSCLILAFIRA